MRKENYCGMFVIMWVFLVSGKPVVPGGNPKDNHTVNEYFIIRI